MVQNVQFFAGLVFFATLIGFLVSRYLRRARISKRVLGSLLADVEETPNVHVPTDFDNWVKSRLGQTKLYKELHEQLEITRSNLDPSRVMVEALIWGAVAAVFGLWAQGLLAMLVLAVLAAAVRLYLPTIRLNRRRAQFQDQMDYSLNLLTASIRSGHSLVKAIEIVAIQSEAPTSQEFAKALNSMRLGRDLGDSLMEIAERMKSQELEWMVQSINIHREAGGNLTEMFETVVATIKDRNSIRVLIRTLSTDGRISGQVMSILPLAVILLFTLQNPESFAVFLTDPVGNFMLALAVGLYLVGILWIQKIVRVKF